MAMDAGLAVLCEKPLAPTVAQGLSTAAASEVTGQLLMVSQSRRYYGSLTAFKEQLASIGDIGVLSTQFFKAPKLSGFRLTLDHILLVEMAIHGFDCARYLLDREPVWARCEEVQPSWSGFAANAAPAASAVFEFEGGVRFMYAGSLVSAGFETSWNGEWRASGSLGTALWDGDNAPTVSTTADVTVDEGAPR
jgi:predicted dehydrogenase